MVNQAGPSKNLPESQPEQPSAPPEPRPKPPSASVKEVGSGSSAPKPPPAGQPRFHYRQPQQTASPSLGPERRGRLHKQAVAGKAENRPGWPLLVQEAPVRDGSGSGWSSDSEVAVQLSRLSHPGRKVEPVKPFSVSLLAAGDAEEFGRLDPDFSDVTVYNEISQKTPGEQTAAAVSCREPTPGSEAHRQQESCPRPLFSELRQHQQDSGFGSPFYHQK